MVCSSLHNHATAFLSKVAACAGSKWGEQVGVIAEIQKSLLSWLVRRLRRVLHLFCAVFVEYEAPAMWIDVVFPQFEQFEVLGCGRGVELMADQ